MSSDISHLAVITARSGSVRLPGKNVRPLNGKPLMAWSALAARESSLFKKIMLSTDSPDYAAIGEEYGAEVPWLRAPGLAGDEVSSIDVIIDILNRFSDEGRHFSHITLLQPTSPLRTATDIIAAWKLMQQKRAGAIVSVSECEHPPQWSNTLPKDLSMKDFITPEALVLRHKLEKHYRVNGAIYMAETSLFRKHRSFFTPHTYAYVMPQERSVDIDTETDFIVAGSIMKLKNTDANG